MKSVQVPLDIAGELQALIADEAIEVTAEHNTITVNLPNVRVGMGALRTVGGRKRRTTAMRRASAALHFTDLNVQFRLAGRTVARLGADAHPGWLSRLLSMLLGLGPLEITPSSAAALARVFWR